MSKADNSIVPLTSEYGKHLQRMNVSRLQLP
jgi:hypothetical protein